MLKISFKLGAFVFFIISFLLLIGIDVRTRTTLQESNIENVIEFFILGVISYVISKFIKGEQYNKCPNCGEMYSMHKLKNNICPTCEVKTIDVEEYYKNNN